MSSRKTSPSSGRKSSAPRKEPEKKPTVKKVAAKKLTKVVAKKSSKSAVSKKPAAKAASKKSITTSGAALKATPKARKYSPPSKAEKSVQKMIDAPAPVAAAATPVVAPHGLFDVDEGMDPGFLPNDEVMDETDYAQHMQLKEQASISHRARELNRPETHPDFDGETCVECGEDIPPARLLLKRVRCVECQTFLEEAAALHRRTRSGV